VNSNPGNVELPAPLHRQLIEQVRKGDREALARLVTLDQASLYHFMLRRLGHREDAADATQEVVRRVIVSLSSLRDPDAYRGWLFRIALVVCQEILRCRNTQQNVLRKSDQARLPQETRIANRAELAELREYVRQAVDQLDDEYRTAILLRYEQCLSYSDIAEATRSPVGTVSKRLHVAHEKLLKLLAAAGASVTLGWVAETLAGVSIDPLPASAAEKIKLALREAGPLRRPFSLSTAASGGLLVVAAVLVSGTGLLFRAARRSEVERELSGDAPHRDRSQASPRSSQVPPKIIPGVGPAPLPVEEAVARATIQGVVRDRDTRFPIPGAEVWIEENRGFPRRRVSAISGADGSFSLEAPAGSYLLDALAAGYVRHDIERSIEANRPEPEGQETDHAKAGHNVIDVGLDSGQRVSHSVDLLRAGEIRGTVVDRRGHPVPEAQVILERHHYVFATPRFVNSYEMSYEPDGQTYKYQADCRGVFAIDHLYPEGSCRLTVSHKGFAPLDQEVPLRPGGIDVRLVLRDGLTLSGRVAGERREPVPGACLLVGVSGPGMSLSVADASSGPDGFFALSELLPEACLVAAYAPEYGVALVDVRGKDASPINLALPQALGKVSGLVLDELGQPLEGVSVSLHQYDLKAAGFQVRMAFLDAQGGGSLETGEDMFAAFLPQTVQPPRASSLSDGRFELGKLAFSPNLSAELTFCKDGYEAVTRTLSGPDFQAVTLTRKAKR
jgi:RNA polymerase sigma-70 factor (ECF subfamily)